MADPEKKGDNDDFEVVVHRDVVFKVIVIGDPEVGKTSLIKKFVRNRIETDYIPTVGVNIAKHVVPYKTPSGEEIPVSLMFWDIAGQKQFYMLHKPYFLGGNGIIFAYDITRPPTFTNIKEWHKTCVKNGLDNVPGIIVGNKIDLKDRKIIAPMAENLGNQLGMPCFETSALTGENVDEIFNEITRLMAEARGIK